MFVGISTNSVVWLESEFEEDEVRLVAFDLAGGKALGSNGLSPRFLLAARGTLQKRTSWPS